jgi:hypothetical protein
MKFTLLALMAAFVTFAAQADTNSLNAKLANFKKQIVAMQSQLADIEKIALGCETYKQQVQEQLVPKSQKARADLGLLLNKMDAAFRAQTGGEAMRLMTEVDRRLQEALAGTSNPENVKNVKFLLTCARPGNPTVERKVDEAIKLLQNLIAINKSIMAELR